jgi:hypothetical protein
MIDKVRRFDPVYMILLIIFFVAFDLGYAIGSLTYSSDPPYERIGVSVLSSIVVIIAAAFTYGRKRP